MEKFSRFVWTSARYTSPFKLVYVVPWILVFLCFSMSSKMVILFKAQIEMYICINARGTFKNTVLKAEEALIQKSRIEIRASVSKISFPKTLPGILSDYRQG